MPFSHKSLFAGLLLVSLITPARGVAEEVAPPSPPTEMAVVTVTGEPEDLLTGSNTLDRSTLDHLPARNGSINEAIGILPGVQLPELGRTSLDAGEIIPPKVSISGGKTFQNNFLIDGITNNSLLDPEAEGPTGVTLVPGHPQAIFLDLDLVEELNVYRYNVPARFGSFTGGVVEAITRDPEPTFSGEISYRTTRSEWTDFHLDPKIEEDFYNSNSQKYQPDFDKHDAGVMLNIPLTDKLSLLTTYQVNYSSISVSHLNASKDLTRKNENFFAKLTYELDPRTQLTASLNHAPYEGDYLYANALGSEFTITGGGDQVTLSMKHDAEWGMLSLTGAWKQSENRRDAPPSGFYIWAVTEDKQWGESLGTKTVGYINQQTATKLSSMLGSYEGSVGSLENSQDGFQLTGEIQAATIISSGVAHHLSAGISFEQVTGEMKREAAFDSYQYPVLVDDPDTFTCPAGSNACIDHQQFLSEWRHYAADAVEAKIHFLDIYAEDHIVWKRLDLRPGVRISYDDFMENTDISPRLAASYDLFGNRETLLIGGLNRYYGRTLLTYKIREASIPAQKFTRNRTTLAWSSTSTQVGFPYRYTNLETPYTDETVAGIDQELFGGRLKIIGLRREGRDEFLRKTVKDEISGLSYNELTNLGESHYESVSLDWERSWEKQAVALNVTWQETGANNEGYDPADFNNIDEIFWYDGKYIAVDELPRLNYNRHWSGNLVYFVQLPYGFDFTNVTRYRSGYETRVRLTSEEKAANGIPDDIKAYRNETFPEAWIFDWRIDWDPFRDERLIVSLEVNNVFDKKAELGDPGVTGSASSSTYVQNYELGRQFWLGLTYKF